MAILQERSRGRLREHGAYRKWAAASAALVGIAKHPDMRTERQPTMYMSCRRASHILIEDLAISQEVRHFQIFIRCKSTQKLQ